MKGKARRFGAYVLIAMLTILSAEVVFWTRGYEFIDRQSDAHSLQEAEFLTDLYLAETKSEDVDPQQFAREYGKKYELRITIIDHNGEVLADSDKNPEEMENHADREEVARALNGESWTARRKSFTLGMNYAYTAVPIKTSDFSGVLRVSVPLTALTDLNIELAKQIILSLGICFLIVLAFSAWLSQKEEDNKKKDVKAEEVRILPFPSRDYKSLMDETIRIDNIVINKTTRVVTIDNEPVNLSKKEFELLYLLVDHRGRVFSREILLEQIWGYDYYGESRTVDVHVRNLRKKIEKDPDHPRYIITVRGYGYKFAD